MTLQTSDLARPKRIMVFGGTGTIGAACCKRLRQDGHPTAVFTRRGGDDISDVEIFTGDIADKESVNAAISTWQPEAVLQLAACLQQETEERPERGIAVNVTGAAHVLQAAVEAGVKRFVYGSSIAAYGERSDLMHESDAPGASISIYGLQKLLGEKLGQQYANQGGLSFVALRYSGIFSAHPPSGAGMALARHKILATAKGDNAEIDFASGDETCHLTYIEDAMDATIRAVLANGLRHDVYNVGGPEGNFISLRNLHEHVRQIVPMAGDVVFSGRARSAGPLDLSRARDDLAFRPRFNIEDALRHLLEA